MSDAPAPEAGGPAPLPLFPVACERFVRFLAAASLPTEVRWVDRDAAAYIPPVVYLRPAPDHQAQARAAYDRGRARGFGILLGCLCVVDGCSYAFVSFPGDWRIAERRGLGAGLHFRTPDAHLRGELASGRMRWLHLKERSRSHVRANADLLL